MDGLSVAPSLGLLEAAEVRPHATLIDRRVVVMSPISPPSPRAITAAAAPRATDTAHTHTSRRRLVRKLRVKRSAPRPEGADRGAEAGGVVAHDAVHAEVE